MEKVKGSTERNNTVEKRREKINKTGRL